MLSIIIDSPYGKVSAHIVHNNLVYLSSSNDNYISGESYYIELSTTGENNWDDIQSIYVGKRRPSGELGTLGDDPARLIAANIQEVWRGYISRNPENLIAAQKDYELGRILQMKKSRDSLVSQVNQKQKSIDELVVEYMSQYGEVP